LIKQIIFLTDFEAIKLKTALTSGAPPRTPLGELTSLSQNPLLK